MANFNIAYRTIIDGHERGYVNDPVDPGKETWDGISRVHNKNWKGWALIDAQKSKHNFPKCLWLDNTLEAWKKDLYFEKYWLPIRGSELTGQSLAVELFDISVNIGPETAVVYLQHALNLLNDNQKRYRNIEEDGKFGQITMNTLRNYEVRSFDSLIYTMSLLINLINGQQMRQYLTFIEKDERREKYIGLYRRVTIRWESHNK